MSNISLLTAIPAPARGTFRRRIARHIIVALAAAFSFAAPAGACSLVCIAAPYTLTGAADTSAAREAACSAAKAGFKPPLLGMLESLPGNTALFAGDKGGVACAAAVTAPAALAAAAASALTYNQFAVNEASGRSVYELYYFLNGVQTQTANYTAQYIIIYSKYSSAIESAYKAAFLANYIAPNSAAIAAAAAAAYRAALEAKYYYLITGCTSNTTCSASIALMHKEINLTAIVNAAIIPCQAAQDASGKLVCCNM